MKNSYKEMFEFIKNNNLNNDYYTLRIIENMNLDDPDVLSKIKEIRKRYDDSKNKYPESIMCQLRESLGLDDKYDTSLDEEINGMNKNDVFNNLLNWNGLIGWDKTIKEWITFIYGIELN